MFKHVSKLFDYHDLAILFNEYERLQASGYNDMATALRAQISQFLSEAETSYF